MAAMSICVLGGTGFVGGHLAARLAEHGHSIRILTRDRERRRDLLVLPTLELIQADVHDQDVLAREFAGCDTVINLVGILNEAGRDGGGFREVHVELVRKTLAACNTAGVRRLLHMSGLNASASHGPSHYLRTKGEAEALIRQHAGEMTFTIFQPSVIFGPGDSFTFKFASLLRFAPFVFPLACADARFAPVYIDDVVAAFVAGLSNKQMERETYQLCGPQVYTLREMVSFIAAVTGRRRKVLGLPDWLSRLQAQIMDFVPGKPFSTDNYQSLKADSVCTQNGLEILGITPHSFETMVPRFLTPGGNEARLSRWRESAGRVNRG